MTLRQIGKGEVRRKIRKREEIESLNGREEGEEIGEKKE